MDVFIRGLAAGEHSWSPALPSVRLACAVKSGEAWYAPLRWVGGSALQGERRAVVRPRLQRTLYCLHTVSFLLRARNVRAPKSLSAGSIDGGRPRIYVRRESVAIGQHGGRAALEAAEGSGAHPGSAWCRERRAAGRSARVICILLGCGAASARITPACTAASKTR